MRNKSPTYFWCYKVEAYFTSFSPCKLDVSIGKQPTVTVSTVTCIDTPVLSMANSGNS